MGEGVVTSIGRIRQQLFHYNLGNYSEYKFLNEMKYYYYDRNVFLLSCGFVVSVLLGD